MAAAAPQRDTVPEPPAVVEVAEDAGVGEPGERVRSVSTFNRTTCALLESGSVRCWGENTTGALGDGTFTDSTRPVRVHELERVVQLDVGLLRACAVVEGGELHCWGNNNSGVLRNGNQEDQNIPVPAMGVKDVVEVSLGESQTCVRRTDFSLECWVYNLNYAALEVQGLTGIVAVEAGYFLTTATLADGSVRTWGENDIAGPVDVDPSRAVSSGYGFVCTLTEDATVRCKGVYSVHDPVERVDGFVPGLSSVANMSSGFEHTCAVTQQGKVYCWGRNNRGQLGDGSTESTSEAREVVGLDHVIEVTCGREHSCAHKADGSVQCWGSNDQGELGDGTTTERHTPVPVIGL
jgi:alpha-tubulin suppressor-like RCC1 family protein